ncbi:MAG: choice-of-anchor D domain-containing protein [Terriglobales bacterium]
MVFVGLLTGCQGLAPSNSTSIGNLAVSSGSLSFGSVSEGSSKSMKETISNPSSSAVTISQASVSGPGFAIEGLNLPVSLAPNQQTSFSVTFTPTAAGSASGTLNIVSNAANSPLGVTLSGSVSGAGSLAANPMSLAFGNVPLGSVANLSETLTNTGGTSVTISQANVTGSAFSVSGLTLPLTLDPNQSVTFTATFAPAVLGSDSETLAIVSDASDSDLSIALSGAGTPVETSQLSISPASLNFGNVNVGSSSSLNASLNAVGGAVTVSSSATNSSEFVLSGITLPVTIGAGQSVTFSVTFTPNASGSTSGKLRFVSSASNSPSDQSLSGTGQAQSHSVGLSWDPAKDAVSYNVYRKLSTDSSYTQIASGETVASYTDTTAASGNTYDYAVTSVDASNQESGYSNIATAAIPSN